jgi:hypothetical protein
MNRRTALLALLTLLAACGANPERQRLDRTKGFAVRRLLEIRRDGSQYREFDEFRVEGVSALPLVVNGAPTDLAPLLWEEPARPWSVRLSWGPQGHVEIDSYGADAAKPLDHMEVDMRVM